MPSSAAVTASRPDCVAAEAAWVGLEQHRLAAQAEAQLMGQLLASALFSALAKRPDALEPERRRTESPRPGDRRQSENL